MNGNFIWGSIRFKIFSIASLTVVGLVLAVFVLSSSIEMANFERLEMEEMDEDLERVSRNLARDQDSLHATALDWSNWDDVYFFADSFDQGFIQEYLGKSSLDRLGMDFVLFIDDQGSMIYYESYVDGEEVSGDLPEGMQWHFRADGFIVTRGLAGEETLGMLALDDELVLMCAHPILTSYGEGPVNGVFVMGKLLDEAEQGMLSAQSNLPLSLHIASPAFLQSELGEAGWSELNRTQTTSRLLGEEIRIGYMQVADAYGSNTVVLRAEIDRDIFLQGKESQETHLMALTFSIVIFGAITIGLMETWVISRVRRLSNDVTDIANSGDTARRVTADGQDEIGALGSNINGMLAALDDSQRELVGMERSNRDTLERQVRERTIELMESNKALGQEVAERQRTEEELRQSESRYRAVVEDQMELIKRTRLDGTITFVNQAYAKYHGLGADMINGTRFQPEMPEDDLVLVQRHLDFISPSRPVVSYQHRVLMPDGSERWQQWTSRGIFDQSGQMAEIQSVGRDMTERVKMEQELLRAQKLESLGRLAGGIAHDFNNILTSIMGNVALAMMDGDLGPTSSHRLQDAEGSVLRAKNLTKQLLTFSEGGEPVKERTDLADLLRDSVDLSVRGTNVQGELDVPADLWEAEVDRGLVRQVIHNLMTNAIEAMPEGGRVQVSAINWTSDGENSVPLPGGDYVIMEFRDQGRGIPRENLDRIFDPFFTTKRKGSGLGLTAAMSIVRKHGGYVSAESEIGEGSAFRIYLPAAKSPTSVPPREERSADLMPRVLLMDDEASILEVVTELLTMLGYDVECAHDGQTALDMYRRAREAGHGYDLVIMDLTIPGGMGGKEAIRRLREAYPGARAMVSSGYSNDPVMSDFSAYGFVGVLQKPYTIQELKVAVAAALTVSPSRQE